MEKKFKDAIESYQCSGCVSGSDISCFVPDDNGVIGCSRHCAGTMATGVGRFFLGMPKGFNRIGEFNKMKLIIYDAFESSEWEYDMWNIPVWKYLSKEGHTFVRGMMPRRNEPFLHVFLEDCMDDVICLEIFQKDIDEMD